MLYPTRRSFEASPNVRNSLKLSETKSSNGNPRRHSSHYASTSALNTLQNQRVAAIIQGTGHSTSSTTFNTNRFTQSNAQNFYASSAPSSSVNLQQKRARPQVPLFHQSTGSIPQSNNFQHAPNTMAGGKSTSRASVVQRLEALADTCQDMNLFDDFAFGDESLTTSFEAAGFSPAVPTMYEDNTMTRSNSNSTNVGTVSPQDLMVRDLTFSAPNSTAFTNLTSPSLYNESPMFDDFDASPLFQNDTADVSGGGDSWFPLFPDAAQETATKAAPVEESLLDQSEEMEVSQQLRKKCRRESSSPKGASASAGVAAARKRTSPLPPIVVEDPSDTVAIKRARNTLAARKSRQKKMERFDELEGEIETLRQEVEYWKNQALQLGAQQ